MSTSRNPSRTAHPAILACYTTAGEGDFLLHVVAEGVENEADAQFLTRIGCEFGQGYYFSPALDGTAVLDYIARHYNTAAAPELG